MFTLKIFSPEEEDIKINKSSMKPLCIRKHKGFFIIGVYTELKTGKEFKGSRGVSQIFSQSSADIIEFFYAKSAFKST